MADPSFLQELPVATQVVVNVGIFIITIIVGLKSYYAGKKEKEKPANDVTFTSSNAKFLEELQDTFDGIATSLEKMAHSVAAIEKTLAEEHRQNEIDREVKRIMWDRNKRGSKRISGDNFLDNKEEDG